MKIIYRGAIPKMKFGELVLQSDVPQVVPDEIGEVLVNKGRVTKVEDSFTKDTLPDRRTLNKEV